jgi:hypothetical protein
MEKNMANFLGKLTGKEEENDSLFPSLSYKERLIGFTASFIIGTIMQFYSFGYSMEEAEGKNEKFAFLYFIGNILYLLG